MRAICLDVDAGWPATAPPFPAPYPPTQDPPVTTNDLTVFAFSQVATNGADPTGLGKDDNVLVVNPDMVLGGWGQWQNYGTSVVEYDNTFVRACHGDGAPAPYIRFMGGGTASAFFRQQAGADDNQFMDFVTRDAQGGLVKHDDLNEGEYRASLANPFFRAYLVNIGKIQIDQGVDGLQYSEVNEAYQGTNLDNDEGFDDYHLADFNAFLLAQTPSSLWQQIGLHADVAPGDLTNNFNYRSYLANHQWAPFDAHNPLATLWGRASLEYPKAGAITFVDNAEPHRYWRQIVDELRAYARTSAARPPGRPFYIGSNGIFPYVDFVGFSLYDSVDLPVSETLFAAVLPPAGPFNGSVNVQPRLQAIKQLASAFAPPPPASPAPVVIYLDGTWNRYHSPILSPVEREDFWRLYSAEVYANGLFFAFLLKAPDVGPSSSHADKMPSPTATDDGTVPIFTALASFYRLNASLYHDVTANAVAATAVQISVQTPPHASLTSAMVAVTDQAASLDATPARPAARRIVHLVNHEYQGQGGLASGIVPQSVVTVTIPVTAVVTSVTLASPDADALAAGVSPAFTQTGSQLTVTLPVWEAYDAIVVSY